MRELNLNAVDIFVNLNSEEKMAFFLYPYSRTARLDTSAQATLGMGGLAKSSPPTKARFAPASHLLDLFRSLYKRLLDLTSVKPMPGTELRKTRTSFHALLADIKSPRTYRVCYQIEASRTLRELWHLRTDVYELLAESRGESEANLRIASLNRHFPEGPKRCSRDSRAAKISSW